MMFWIEKQVIYAFFILLISMHLSCNMIPVLGTSFQYCREFALLWRMFSSVEVHHRYCRGIRPCALGGYHKYWGGISSVHCRFIPKVLFVSLHSIECPLQYWIFSTELMVPSHISYGITQHDLWHHPTVLDTL